ncbi:Uncharacterised protein [Bordetella pertussis]|nr:Uncharacterised protein [Bordetella pertussis]
MTGLACPARQNPFTAHARGEKSSVVLLMTSIEKLALTSSKSTASMRRR